MDKLEMALAVHPRFVTCLTLCVCALLILSRRPEAVTNAQFWAEDGRWFSDAYNLGLTALLVAYGGYLVVMYHFVAVVALLFPFKYVPLLFNLCALGFQLLPLVLINSSRFKKIIPYRSLAILISLLYVSLPSSSEVFLNLTNIQWHLGIAAFLVLIAEKSDKVFWKIFDVSVLVATGLSGPLVILLFPIAGFLWRQTKSAWSKRNFIVTGVMTELQVGAILLLSDYGRVGGQPDASVIKFIKMIVGQVFTSSTFGEKSAAFLYGNMAALLLVFGFMIGIFLYVLKNAPLWLKLFNVYGLMVVCSMLASLRPLKDFDVWNGLTNPGGGQRYWYIPMVVWLATLIWLLFRASFTPLRYVSAALLLCLIVAGMPRDWKLKPYTDLNFPSYARKFDETPRGSVVSVPINPGWYVNLIKK